MSSTVDTHARLAQFFDEIGLCVVADVIDAQLARFAQTEMTPAKHAHYKKLLDEGFRKKYPIQSLDIQMSVSRPTASFWLYPDGNVMVLGRDFHESSFAKVTNETMVNNEPLWKDPAFAQMYDKHDVYSVMGEYFGAIRLYYDGDDLEVSSYVMPTSAQIQGVVKMAHLLDAKDVDIDQHGYVIGDYYQAHDVSDWIAQIRRYESAQRTTQNQVPEISTYELTMRDVNDQAMQSVHTPYSKAMEKRRLEEEYPGPDNQKLRQLYERSAQKLHL